MRRSIVNIGLPTLVAAIFLAVFSSFRTERLLLSNLGALAESIAISKDRKFEVWKTVIEHLSGSYTLLRDYDLGRICWMAEQMATHYGGWVVMTPAKNLSLIYINTAIEGRFPIQAEVRTPELFAVLEKARASGDPQVSDLFWAPVMETHALVAAKTVTSSSGEELFLTLTYDQAVLTDGLSNYMLPREAFALIVDGSNRVVATSKQVERLFLEEIPDWLNRSLHTAPFSSGHDGRFSVLDDRSYLYAHQQIKGAPHWHVIVAQPRERLLNLNLREGGPILGALVVLLLAGAFEWRRLSENARSERLQKTLVYLQRERDLRADLQKAVDHSRLMEVSRRKMLGVLGHEMRTPVISALAALKLLNDGNRSGEQQRILILADKGLRMLHSLIDDILDLTRLDAHDFTMVKSPFSISALLEEAIDILSPMAERHKVSLEKDLRDVDIHVLGDYNRLRQILVNLLSNAIKYAPRMPITLHGSWHRDENGKWAVRICVIDGGPGIPAEKIGDLFEPFVRLREDGRGNISGLGLGLPIAKRLAEAMGGTIEIFSQLGEGSTFCLQLSLPEAPFVAPDAREVVHEQNVDLSGVNILMVEDHLLQAAMFEAMLKSMKANVTIKATGEDAIEAFRNTSYDVVLIDLGLPDMMGVELARMLRQSAVKAGFVVLSANPGSLSAQERELFNSALSKSAETHEIGEAILNAIRRDV